ncbi:MAG TPA: cupin domain-containing protein [Steroidobacteraceae bacterium]|jgi:quercetin dioxygenase-like cupin family protein|nr:cupin domain-containing protein [Steroidobacteraceae bacterium]
MSARIATLSLGLLFTVAYAAPLFSPQLRLTPSEVDAMPAHDSGAGTSGVAGIRTTVMSGDSTQDGPYTIRLSVPANTKIQAHTHRDDRTAIVVSGVWYFGYGPLAGAGAEKALPAGSFYTEPGGIAHFAETKADRVIVYITGHGPTDTVYLK